MGPNLPRLPTFLWGERSLLVRLIALLSLGLSAELWFKVDGVGLRDLFSSLRRRYSGRRVTLVSAPIPWSRRRCWLRQLCAPLWA